MFSLDYSEELERTERKMLCSIICWHALMKLLSPLPYDVYSSADARPSIWYLGTLSVAARAVVRRYRFHEIPCVARDAPKCFIDVCGAITQYWTLEMMQAGGGGALLPNISPDGLPPMTDLVGTWSWTDWYDPPTSTVQGVDVLLSLKEHNLLMRWGVCYRPAPRKFYPMRYYGAYGRDEVDGLLRIEEMKLSGFCRYRSEGCGMGGDLNIEDYPELPRSHARVRRAILAEKLGIVDQVGDF